MEPTNPSERENSNEDQSIAVDVNAKMLSSAFRWIMVVAFGLAIFTVGRGCYKKAQEDREIAAMRVEMQVKADQDKKLNLIAEENKKRELEIEELKLKQELKKTESSSSSATNGQNSSSINHESSKANPEVSSSGSNSDVKFPEMSSSVISAAEASSMSYAKLRYAINEVHARHGYSFVDHSIYNEFSKRTWYHPEPNLTEDQCMSRMTPIEQENVRTLSAAKARKKPE